MQNVFVNMCEKFHNARLRNDRALGNGKSDSKKKKKNNNNNKNNIRSACRPISGSNKNCWLSAHVSNILSIILIILEGEGFKLCRLTGLMAYVLPGLAMQLIGSLWLGTFHGGLGFTSASCVLLWFSCNSYLS